MAFGSLQLNEVACFGWRGKKEPDGNGGYRAAEPGWVQLAVESETKGWREVDVDELERDMAANVDASYSRICSAKMLDVETGTTWSCAFENDTGSWILEIDGSNDTEVLPEDAKGFFGSDDFGKFARRCAQLVDRAVAAYRKDVERHMDDGELLAVDEVKLARILDCCDKSYFMENMRTKKFRLK